MGMTMNYLDIKKIQEIIPHRHPFLLVDFIEDYEPGEYAVGYKCVTYTESFFSRTFSTGASYARRTYYRSISPGRSCRHFI